MEQTTASTTRNDSRIATESTASGVSWAAVIAGGFVAAALSLILLALGAGLGLSSVSVWSNTGANASTVGGATIIWLILMEVISAGMGGYLAGRLRTKWANVHTDEVYFRDTAHGFLSWCVAVVITAAFLASAAATMAGAAATTAAAATSAAAEKGSGGDYFVDSLLRTDGSKTDANSAPPTAEAGRILANALRQGAIPAADKTYLDQMVAARTGMTQQDADRRVNDVFTNAREAAETARKNTAHGLLWAFLALLIGAFCASFAATLGGRQRDNVKTV